MSLPMKKIYVDTKYMASDSRSTSDFKINLPISLTFPPNSCFFITECSIPFSWYSIETGINDKIYIMVSPVAIVEAINGDDVKFEIVTLDAGNYNGIDLATEIQEKINAVLFPYSTVLVLITCTYSAKKNNLVFNMESPLYKFRILTPTEIKNKLNNTWTGHNYDTNKPDDMNEIIGNLEPSSTFHFFINPYSSNSLILQTIRNIYLHSNIGNYSSIGARGESNIIKKIPVSSNSNEMIFDEMNQGNDFSVCSGNTLRTLEFQLKDVRGNIIPLHGHHVSFSILFSIQAENM